VRRLRDALDYGTCWEEAHSASTRPARRPATIDDDTMGPPAPPHLQCDWLHHGRMGIGAIVVFFIVAILFWGAYEQQARL
jgi:hypothetical protein